MYCKIQEESTWWCSLTVAGRALPRRWQPAESQPSRAGPGPTATHSPAQGAFKGLYRPNWLFVRGTFVLVQQGNPNSHSLPFIHTNNLFWPWFMSH